MKKMLRVCLIPSIGFLAGCALVRPSEKKAPPKARLVLTYWDSSAGGEDQAGFDTKMLVFVDGEIAGESAPAGRYERKTLAVDVEPGSHVIIVEGYARADGGWEKRTKEKGYAVDHRLEKEVDFGAGETRAINFVVPDRSNRLEIKL